MPAADKMIATQPLIQSFFGEGIGPDRTVLAGDLMLLDRAITKHADNF
jgi:hypothetical protein